MHFRRCEVPTRTYNDRKITLTSMPTYHRKDCLRMIFVWSWKLYLKKFDSESFMCIYIRVLFFIVQRNIPNKTNDIKSEILKTNCIKLLVWIHLFSVDNQRNHGCTVLEMTREREYCVLAMRGFWVLWWACRYQDLLYSFVKILNGLI